MKILSKLVLFLALALPAQATTYYIDFVGGADTNAGTSTGAAWKRAPGMTGCVSTCASTTPVAGDNFIFKGGVTWDNTCFYWPISWNGTSASRIYFGIDVTWFTGGSWARPIFDLGGNFATTKNVMLWITGNYITVDNIEMKGLKPTQGTFGEDTFVNPQTSTNGLIKNVYMHGWTELAGSDKGIGIGFATIYPAFLNAGWVVDNLLVDGSDTTSVLADPNCTGSCLGTFTGVYGALPTLINSRFKNLVGGAVGSFDDVHGNIFEYGRNSQDPAQHENGFLNNRTCNATFHHNVLRHFVAGQTAGFAEEVGCTGQVYDNLLWDTTAGNVLAISLPTPYGGCTADSRGLCDGGSINVFNNTVECGPDSNPTNQCGVCPNASESNLGYDFTNCTAKNNHWITSNATPFGGTGNVTLATNVTQTKAAANAEGYITTNGFAPTGETDSTVEVGTDLSAFFTTDIIAIQRPQIVLWDVGAYEYNPGNPPPPPPPPDKTSILGKVKIQGSVKVP